MIRYVGLFKELGDDEHSIVENNALTPTIFKKHAQVKKLIGHKTQDVPVSCFMTNIYLTNKRFMFLIIREVEALVLRKKGVPTLTGLEGSWYEIPISAIRSVEPVHREVKKVKELKKILPSLSDQKTVSIVEITYEGENTSGNLKDYMESMFDAQGLAGMFDLKNVEGLMNKAQLIGEHNVTLVPKLKGMLS